MNSSMPPGTGIVQLVRAEGFKASKLGCSKSTVSPEGSMKIDHLLENSHTRRTYDLACARGFRGTHKCDCGAPAFKHKRLCPRRVSIARRIAATRALADAITIDPNAAAGRMARPGCFSMRAIFAVRGLIPRL